MKKVLFALCSIFILVGFISAQTTQRTITNLDLEKYKNQRLQAEKDLRENYEKLGFPSPEELEKQQKAEDEERAALSEKLRLERLEREQIYYQMQYLQSQDSPDLYVIQNSNGYRSFPYYSGGYYSKPRYNSNRYNNNNQYYRNGIGPVGGGFFGPRINPYQPNRTILNSTKIFTPNPTPRQPHGRNPR